MLKITVGQTVVWQFFESSSLCGFELSIDSKKYKSQNLSVRQGGTKC